MSLHLMSDVEVHLLADRPDLADSPYDIDDGWPEFMSHDATANMLFFRISRVFPRYCVVATDERGTLVARGRAVPFAWGGSGREALPDGGLDRVAVWAFRDHDRGVATNAASAVEIAIDASHRGRGLSHRMLGALADACRRAGAEQLFAPVRPTQKHLDPHLPTRGCACTSAPAAPSCGSRLHR